MCISACVSPVLVTTPITNYAGLAVLRRAHSHKMGLTCHVRGSQTFGAQLLDPSRPNPSFKRLDIIKAGSGPSPSSNFLEFTKPSSYKVRAKGNFFVGPIAYGGAHEHANLGVCKLAGGFHTSFRGGVHTSFPGGFYTRSWRQTHSWEALRMLRVPAHKWDNDAWAGNLQGLSESEQLEIDHESAEIGLRGEDSSENIYAGSSVLDRVEEDTKEAVSCGNAVNVAAPTSDSEAHVFESDFENSAHNWHQPQEDFAPAEELGSRRNTCGGAQNDRAEPGNGAEGGIRTGGAHSHPLTSGPEGGLAWLEELRISNFALVDSQTVPFGPGLNVITGESGSGKSILLQALAQILGAPLAEDSIRPPATSSSLEGRFTLGPALRPILAFHLDGHPTAVDATLGDAGTSMEGGSVQLVLAREVAVRGEENGAKVGGVDRKVGKARGVCKINGVVVPLKVLRRVGAMLVDVNGQNSQATLRTESAQLEMLDRHAGASSHRGLFTHHMERARAIGSELEELGRGGEREEEELTEFVEDVRELGMDYGEEDALRAELKQQELEQAAADHCRAVHSLMSEPGPSGRGLSTGRNGAGITGSLRSIVRELESIGGEQSDGGDLPTWSGDAAGSDVSDALDMVVEAQALLEAAEARVQEFASNLRFSEARTLQLKQKLRQLQQLLRRYGVETADELLEKAEEAEARLNGTGDAELRREALHTEWNALAPALCKSALELSLQRRRAAEGLRQAVEEALKQLAMERSRFHVDVAWVRSAAASEQGRLDDPTSAYDVDEDEEDDYEEDDDFEGEDDVAEAAASRDEGPTLLVDKGLLRIAGAEQVGESSSAYYHYTASGVDKVTFKLAAAAGEPLLPLTNVASGGECARVMLALKTVPGAAEGGVPVAVFDELDSGVGGRIGARVGSSLRRLAAAGHQVLCVTHLPQVAAYADQHVRVLKEPAPDGRLITRAELLDREDARLEEIASMLGLGLPAARDLLANVGGNGSVPRPHNGHSATGRPVDALL